MTPLPRGFPFAAAWLGFGFLCAVWPLGRAFSGYTGLMIEAPRPVILTALGVFVALLCVFVNLVRLRPAGVWLSVALAWIFAVSGLLRLPALSSSGGGPGVIWVVGISAMLHIAAAVYLSRPAVLAAIERRRLEHAATDIPRSALPQPKEEG
ncbi:MAG TPA: hypothetical protein VFQ07_11935 [Candidatus Polarisedimenticolia bacterium]|nr:hypothetical protein [Candidatus Polarisedimenticolia bacterium]